MTTMITITPNSTYSMDITEPVEAAPEVGALVHDTNRALSVRNVFKILAYLAAIGIVGAGIPMDIFYFWNQYNIWGYWGTELTGWAMAHAACWIAGFLVVAGTTRLVRFAARKMGK